MSVIRHDVGLDGAVINSFFFVIFVVSVSPILAFSPKTGHKLRQVRIFLSRRTRASADERNRLVAEPNGRVARREALGRARSILGEAFEQLVRIDVCKLLARRKL